MYKHYWGTSKILVIWIDSCCVCERRTLATEEGSREILLLPVNSRDPGRRENGSMTSCQPITSPESTAVLTSSLNYPQKTEASWLCFFYLAQWDTNVFVGSRGLTLPWLCSPCCSHPCHRWWRPCCSWAANALGCVPAALQGGSQHQREQEEYKGNGCVENEGRLTEPLRLEKDH